MTNGKGTFTNEIDFSDYDKQKDLTVMENRYDRYKDSGIAWIGEIPEHWEVTLFKRKITINNGKDYKNFSDAEIYPVIGSGGYFAYCSNYMYDGEALLLGRKGTIDKPLYVKGKFWAVDTMFYAIPHKDLHCKFSYYLALTFPFNLYSTSTSLPSLTQTDLGNIPVAFPSISEQQAIADYLDRRCSEIDDLIALQEEMITKLQSYKQSVITEAVTRGLDKNVPLKDSGIDWIGKIPEHWKTYKLKRCAQFINGFAFNSNKFNKNTGIPVIRIGDISNEYISFDNIVYVKEDIELEKVIAKRNDILIAMSGATVGKIGIYKTEDKAYINQRVGIIRTIQYNFIKRIFATQGFTDYVNLSSAGSAQPNISSDGILNFYIPAPPLAEQQAIADYLDQRCSEIDELIALKQQKIEKLKEYKKSLIFECVTGKRKVS